MKKATLPSEIGRLGEDELFIHEFFLSLQGESTFAGAPCYFMRLAGCHLRCAWCDTPYAFHEGRVHTVSECIQRAEESPCRLVEVTGGEPLLQEAVYPLMEGLCDRGFRVLLETSGAVDIDRVDRRVHRIVDWKCPSSGMAAHNNPSVIEDLRAGDEMKLVLANRTDYEWGRKWLAESRGSFPAEVPVHFSPAFGRLPFKDLAAWILEDGLEVRLNLQLHKLVWDPETRGV